MQTIQKRIFGKTALEVTPLGYGTAQLGYLDIPLAQSDRILGGVLDAGINVLDTAECYPHAEEKIGRAIAHRRDEYYLFTKCGHHVEDHEPPEWSGPLVRYSAERSLRRLRTDHLDLLLLHSCSAEVLRRGDVIEILQRCKADGLTRHIGYSGDGHDAEVALAMNVFDCLETSVSICDQQVLNKVLPLARAASLGVMAKRSMANTCWRNLAVEEPAYAGYAATYTDRLKQMNFTPESIGFDGSWEELALRFTAWQPGLHVALVGGRNIEHIEADIRIIDHGPLPESIVQTLRAIWSHHDDGTWVGQS